MHYTIWFTPQELDQGSVPDGYMALYQSCHCHERVIYRKDNPIWQPAKSRFLELVKSLPSHIQFRLSSVKNSILTHQESWITNGQAQDHLCLPELRLPVAAVAGEMPGLQPVEQSG